MVRRTLTVVVISAALVLGLAAPAWAPRTWFLPVLYNAECTMPDGSAGFFSGNISVERFVEGHDGLAAEIKLSGHCYDTDGNEAHLVPGQTPTTEIESLVVSCERLEFVLAAVTAEARAGEVVVGPISASVENGEERGRVFGSLCALARQVKHAPLSVQVDALNRLLAAV